MKRNSCRCEWNCHETGRKMGRPPSTPSPQTQLIEAVSGFQEVGLGFLEAGLGLWEAELGFPEAGKGYHAAKSGLLEAGLSHLEA